MRCVDVNLLVYAYRPDSPRHAEHAEWLDQARRAGEPLAIPSLSLAGFLRIVTHPRIFAEPADLTDALDFAEILRGSPNRVAIEPGSRHWEIFARLCQAADVRGNLVADAHLAALAIEHGAVMYSADRDFARFPGLRWRHPLDREA